ncbi:phospholipase D-like domain-containing anti-phage protein [Bellilinea sp.]|uniref:phospholipase D-like domain-containing anti-phage protein n=1 Tax=Bellilinea sp. TaxID=2838785 RepID=UPI002ADD8709|nr:phospholipase D-like domain-containing anti-phage protein [Bellilinea sp.]
MSESLIHRFSSRRQKLGRTFLAERLRGALAYDRIAGYFTSSLLEVVGEELESVQGKIRMVCNSQLDERDVATARAARDSLWLMWGNSAPEQLLDMPGGERLRGRFERLYNLLRSGKLEVRVLPDDAFGLIHGKAGIITLANGSRISFLGSTNESRQAWEMNYELVWEDSSPEGVAWMQEEFDALWTSPFAVPLADAIVTDIERLSKRRVIYQLPEWQRGTREPAPVIVETPLYRKSNGLWPHQKYFIKLAYEAHHGPYGKARYILADQVGLGKTIQLATAALLMVLTGEKPVLILAPKTLLWQWQTEMRDLLDMPSAVWNGKQWVDESGLVYPSNGPEDILKCPRRVGIVSTGLISRQSEIVNYLLRLEYECVILDEAHRARRRNPHRPDEKAEPNNLFSFMQKIAERTRSLLLATATPIQLHPIEVWDLLEVLSQGADEVLGNAFSRWRQAKDALPLITGSKSPPTDLNEQWEWYRNPLPPAGEGRDFEILRRKLNVPADQSVVPGDMLEHLSEPDRNRIQKNFANFLQNHNPLLRHIVRRTREQLENQRDPETHEPYMPRIEIKLFGEAPHEAIPLPAYLHRAYNLAEEFCKQFGERKKGSGFLETLLLRRLGSSIYAGQCTVERILGNSFEEEEEEEEKEDAPAIVSSRLAEQITSSERKILEELHLALSANRERDPKYEKVREFLIQHKWLEKFGCIIFSQYRDSIQWLGEQLTVELPEEPIALYSGPQTSGLFQHGQWIPMGREEIKRLVAQDKIRLLLGTDAASEGLNLQRLGSLINLDLPWNPTRLEQRKGRIQRIGQRFSTVYVCNLRYKDSVEDRVHSLLSERLENIYSVFGQLPDVLEDAWIALAQGERERAASIIDAIPRQHPFEIRYTRVENVNWETCAEVLHGQARREVLQKGWKE